MPSRDELTRPITIAFIIVLNHSLLAANSRRTGYLRIHSSNPPSGVVASMVAPFSDDPIVYYRLREVAHDIPGGHILEETGAVVDPHNPENAASVASDEVGVWRQGRVIGRHDHYPYCLSVGQDIPNHGIDKIPTFGVLAIRPLVVDYYAMVVLFTDNLTPQALPLSPVLIVIPTPIMEQEGPDISVTRIDGATRYAP